MDRKLYLIRKFVFESLNDKEKREFEEYAISDKKFRRMILRGAELRGMINELLGERLEDDPEYKRILLEEEQEEKERQRAQGAGHRAGSEEEEKERQRVQGAGRRAGSEEENRQGRKGNRYRKLFIYIGSGIAAIIILSLVIVALWREPQNERFYAQSFTSMEIDSYRGVQQSQQESILLQLYQEKDYKAIRAAADIPSMLEKFNDLDYLLAGISFMEGKNFISAEKMLSTITEKSEQYYNAAWYLGLIRLRNNQIEDCRKYLHLAQESLIFRERALKLMDEIKKLD